ncbi:MAG TPA: NADH-ubiquinone oxidoreductase-F iron-sulfur binding region domain-containing protein [Acidimicrobiales bacterium]|nr:NADH-ubiquinone oxidoreductase-F iron-sulfur binding region domain-containing protein [Acidimicrobiales bacterium]
MSRPVDNHLRPDAAQVPRLLALVGGSGLDAHFSRWGPVPGGGRALIAEVERSGLRGRGGAAFPTAVKMRSVLGRRQAVVVANGAEREPVSAKDKAVLTYAPHLVLDGVSMAAEAVGASEAVVCIDRSATEALSAVSRALTERSRAGADVVPIRIETTPSAYVTGEESALVHWLNGGPAKPTFVPPRPFEKGVRGRPTLVNNVETLAHLALVGRFGADWFRAVGCDAEPGTTLVTVNGAVTRPGVVEVPRGASLGSVVDRAAPAGPPQAVLVGGYSGTWVPYQPAAGVGLDSVSLGRLQASLGCASLTVLGPDSCGLAETAVAVRWMAAQSAGQCGPCVHGLPALADAFAGVVSGDRRGSALRRVNQLLPVITGRGACHHPDGVTRMVRSAMTVFASDIDNHRRQGPCRVRHGLLPAAPGAPSWR